MIGEGRRAIVLREPSKGPSRIARAAADVDGTAWRLEERAPRLSEIDLEGADVVVLDDVRLGEDGLDAAEQTELVRRVRDAGVGLVAFARRRRSS